MGAFTESKFSKSKRNGSADQPEGLSNSFPSTR
jgi:hypothetical protein